MWRAVYEVVDSAQPRTPYCASWQSVDSLTYGGVSIDEFIVERSTDGLALSITPSAFDIRLERLHEQDIQVA